MNASAPAMRKEQRLRSRKDFAAVYRQGRAQSNHLLVVRVSANDRAVSRFGFVVGKVVGGAVVRNRIKRRLRAIVDSLDVQPGWDVVIGARKAAADAEFSALQRSLTALLARCAVTAAGVTR